MTTIKARCPNCGEVGLAPDEVDLCVDPHDATASTYGFACPECSEPVRRPADHRVIALLLSGGVVARTVEPVARTLAERFDRDPIVFDDLLDFHALLAGDSWYDALLAAVEA